MAFGRRYFHNLPIRTAAGAFILNSGIGKLTSDDAALEHVYSTAITAYPFLESFGSANFGKLLGLYESTVGCALLAPFVSDSKAGTIMLPFTIGLVGLYLKIPGMRMEGSLRPSSQGIALAKDSWLLAIALSLIISRPNRNVTSRRLSATTSE